MKEVTIKRSLRRYSEGSYEPYKCRRCGRALEPKEVAWRLSSGEYYCTTCAEEVVVDA